MAQRLRILAKIESGLQAALVLGVVQAERVCEMGGFDLASWGVDFPAQGGAWRAHFWKGDLVLLMEGDGQGDLGGQWAPSLS